MVGTNHLFSSYLGVKIVISDLPYVGNITLLVDRRGLLLLFCPNSWEAVGTYKWYFVFL